MIKIERQELLNKLKSLISNDRYEHTLRVEQTAIELARRFGADEKKASLAALLHDCAKSISKDPEGFSKEHGIYEFLHKYDYLPLPLLHAPMGAHLAKAEFGVLDEEILSAITWHTSGKPNMSLMDKIIYLADYTEPGRTEIKEIDEVRSLCKADLDKALLKAFEYSIKYIKAKGKEIHSDTLKAYEYMKESAEN